MKWFLVHQILDQVEKLKGKDKGNCLKGFFFSINCGCVVIKGGEIGESKLILLIPNHRVFKRERKDDYRLVWHSV